MENDSVDKLKTNPLGNHHLIVEGNWIDAIRLACQVKEISLI